VIARRAALAAWQRWLAAAGPWRGFSSCPTLLSPELEHITPRTPSTQRADALAARLAPTLSRPGVLCVLDVDPIVGVQVAARLAHVAYPVLVLPRWPYADAVLPVDGLLGALFDESQRLPPSPASASVVFVLDGERGSLTTRARVDRRADNRHTLPIFDLPTLATLRIRGIQRVVKVA
jgi:hypothetical protein